MVTVLEGFLARGDRRCSDVILSAYRKGALYDAWSESFHYDIWKEAFKETGVDLEFILFVNEVLMKFFHGILLSRCYQRIPDPGVEACQRRNCHS